jgi:hypothetical protein
MKIDHAIARLIKASKKLHEEQGRIARRNARKEYLEAVRHARKAVDQEYPVIRKPVTKRRKKDPRRAVKGKARISQQIHRQLLSAGINPSQFVERGKAGETSHVIYAPRWMERAWRAEVGLDIIAKAVRSMKLRRRIDGIVRLKGVS